MGEENIPINVNNELIENYLRIPGTTLEPRGKNQDKEIKRGIMAGWAAYGNISGYLQRQHFH